LPKNTLKAADGERKKRGLTLGGKTHLPSITNECALSTYKGKFGREKSTLTTRKETDGGGLPSETVSAYRVTLFRKKENERWIDRERGVIVKRGAIDGRGIGDAPTRNSNLSREGGRRRRAGST